MHQKRRNNWKQYFGNVGKQRSLMMCFIQTAHKERSFTLNHMHHKEGSFHMYDASKRVLMHLSPEDKLHLVHKNQLVN